MKEEFLYYGMKYWAEIQVEGENSFYFVHACGMNKGELMKDIKERFQRNVGRDPEIAIALYDPAGQRKDITKSIKKEFEKICNAADASNKLKC